jgi:hypothetical protein
VIFKKSRKSAYSRDGVAEALGYGCNHGDIGEVGIREDLFKGQTKIILDDRASANLRGASACYRGKPVATF